MNLNLFFHIRSLIPLTVEIPENNFEYSVLIT